MPTNITDHKNQTKDLGEWLDFVYDGIKRARQHAWEKIARNRPNYKGMERGVDEATTRQFYQKPAQKDPMKAGALHTILADGVWTPRRAHKRKTIVMETVSCAEKRMPELTIC
eukprot:14990902-Heterocapsa_arctica.AAC.1